MYPTLKTLIEAGEFIKNQQGQAGQWCAIYKYQGHYYKEDRGMVNKVPEYAVEFLFI